MAIEKTIQIDGEPVKFKASAAVPRMYRVKFGRDIYSDFMALQKDADSGQMLPESLELFENIAYIMAKHADQSIPDDPDEWLERFNTFSIYEILPQLLELWGLNTETKISAKKKKGPQTDP